MATGAMSVNMSAGVTGPSHAVGNVVRFSDASALDR